jgi:hypothetical protein
MAKFWLYHLPLSVGVRVGQRGPSVPQAQSFDSLGEAQKAPVQPGFRPVIEGPDGAFVYNDGRWSPQFSRADVIEGVGGPPLKREYVERRVSDWASRIEALYRLIESWLPPGWRAERRGTVQMLEEQMRKVNVLSRDLPVLDLENHAGKTARIEPRGLWVIGANGRLDFSGGKDHYVIFDEAEKFAPPFWYMARLSDRTNLRPLSKEDFVDAL